MPSSFKSFLHSFRFLPVCFFVLISLLAYSSATGIVSPRLFALCAILLMLGLLIGLAYRYRRAQAAKSIQDSNPSLTGNSARVNSATKTLRVAIVVMPLLLLNGLWVTRGQPLLLRFVGAAINLLITAYFVFLLRRAKNAKSRYRRSSYWNRGSRRL